jgi:hypothetical protein
MTRTARLVASLALLASAIGCAAQSTTTTDAATSPPATSPPATLAPANAVATATPEATVATPHPHERHVVAYGDPRPPTPHPDLPVPPRPAVHAIATRSPLAGVLLAPPNAPPRILGITQSPSELHGGATATFTVTTTSNVASVELRAVTFGSTMKRPKIGTFTLSQWVPPLPPLMPHTFAVSFIARNAAGVAVTRVQSITIH